MPGSKQDNKVAKAAERKRLRNRLVRRSVKTYIAKARSAAEAGDESVRLKAALAISTIDKAVSKGIIHKNKAARLKSRLCARLAKE